MKILTPLLISLLLFSSCTYYIGPNRWAKSFEPGPEFTPSQTEKLTLSEAEKIELGRPILEHYAEQKMESWSDKFEDTIPDVKVLIAHLLLQKNVPEINQLIMKHTAWGTTGTSSKVNPKGDYDFSAIQWCQMLGLFEKDTQILYPATQQHIIDYLLIDNGNKPTLRAPKTMGLIKETENHILMKEGSRYLKNQWLYAHTGEEKYNNASNGMDAFFIEHLEEMERTGFFEYNSIPYSSLTFEALLILHKHIKNTHIQESIETIMHQEHWLYALGTYENKKYAPFRRRLSRYTEINLYDDRQTPFISVHLMKKEHSQMQMSDFTCCQDRNIAALMSNYTLPEHTVAMIAQKPNETYFARIGRGLKAAPEIYTGNANYLISAGGVRFGFASQIVPRATTLFLADESKTIEDCFHIKGKEHPLKWNNTGVYKNFAVGTANVFVPQNFTYSDSTEVWKVYPLADLDKYVLVHNQTDMGIFYVAESKADMEKVLASNTKVKTLSKQITLGDGTVVKFQVNAGKKWVIQKVNQEKTTKRFKHWDRINLEFGALRKV